MKEWKKVCDFANGIVYASGNQRKLVIPNHPDIFFKLDTKEIRWNPSTFNGEAMGQKKVLQHG
ncbi:MAG TPA: hypothetical protein G4O16_09205 [Dehalococcoidia bacterium]|nr:hypothetical protein [Dehalococcoidia bacterium]